MGFDQELDTELANYEPTDTESDVQDENVQMQSAEPVDAVPGSAPAAQVSDNELDRISGSAPPAPTMPAQQLGSPNPMQAAGQALEAGNATATAQGQFGAAQDEHAQAMAQAAEDRDVQAKMDAQERLDQQAAQQKALEATHKETEAAAKKYEDFKFHDHWKEAPVANKVLAVIFSGIGGAAAARTGGQNEALRAMDDISQREYQKDVQQLAKAENVMKWRKEGETDLQSRFEKERAGLQMQQASRLKQMSDMAEAQFVKTHPGATPEDAKNNVIVNGLKQKAAETYSSAVRDIYKIEAAKQAAALRAKKAGGGGGNQAGLSTLIKMREDGAPDSAIAAKAAELHIPPKVWLPGIKDVSARDKTATSEGNAEKKLSAADEARTVVFDGRRYLAPTSRLVDKVDQRLINYGDAEESLEDLLKYHKSDPLKAKLPLGDRYDRAVLAVATVTTANASDKTTTHEANTIKNYGLSSPEAIKRTLDHVKQRKQAFLSTLKPVDDEPKSTAKESKSGPSIVESRKVNGVIWNKMSDGTFIKGG